MSIEVNKRIFQIVLFTLFAPSLIIAQGRNIGNHSIYFTNLDERQGLPSSVTNSIVEDNNGFIWIGTEEGICKYDGYKMTVFKHQLSASSIPSNNISALLKDGDLIWIGTWQGLCTINTITDKIERINIGSSKTIRALSKDKEGNIWIGTLNGLIIYNKSRNSFRYYDSQNSNLSHNTIRTFYSASNGDMWIGTYNKINRYSNDSFISFDLKVDYRNYMKNNLILDIEAFDKNNDSLLWVGTETGLCLFNAINGESVLYNINNTNFSNEVIKCIHRQNDSILWLGTDFGLNRFNIQTKDVQIDFHDPLIKSTIANNVISQIYPDSKQRLWFITSNGVSLLDNHQMTYELHEIYDFYDQSRIGIQIRDILAKSDNEIWFASIYGIGLHNISKGVIEKFTQSANKNKKLLLNNVYALKEDDNERLWIGTAGGINIWDKRKNKMYAISADKNNGLNSNYINSFAKDSDGSFWVSAWEGGLFKVIEGMENPGQMKFKLVDGKVDGRVVAAGNDIYLTDNNILWHINKTTYEKTSVNIVNSALKNKTLSSIIGNKKGDIWIGAENLLLKYSKNNERLEHFEINTGYHEKLISIVEDLDGNIWTATYNTIIKIDTKNKSTLTIPLSPNLPLKGFYYNCATMDQKGNLYFGGDNGYIKIKPDSITISCQNHKTVLTRMFVNNQLITPQDSLNLINKSINNCEHLELEHYQNSLTFEFSNLNFLYSGTGQYSYRLKNYQKNWQKISNAINFAVYTNLPPGDYQFEVKGTDKFGQWNVPNTLNIRIKKPLWLSNTFIFLYITLFVGVSFLTFQILRNRYRLNQQLKIARLEKIHSEELYRSKQQFFTNISHEFRTPLSLIIPPIQQILESDITHEHNKKLLKLANRNAKRLHKLVNQLLDFGKIETTKLSLNLTNVELVSFCRFAFSSFNDLAKRNEIDYTFKCEQEFINTQIDIEKFETILFNLLSNAFKFTPFAGSISLHIRLNENNSEGKQIIIKTIDSGKGIAKEEQKYIFDRFYQGTLGKEINIGSGIGLTMSQEYAKLHKGSINIESVVDKGSTFILKLPLMPIDENKDQKIAETITIEKSAKDYFEGKADANAKSILIVDDNEEILEYIEMNLASHYKISKALNGREGLERLQKNKPDLVISDIMMPEMDGISFCSEIKNNPLTAHLPVILLSAKTLVEHQAEGMKEGADMYVTKPFDIEYLKACIESIFRREEQLINYIRKTISLNPEKKNENDKNQEEIFLRKVISIIERNISNPNLSVELISQKIGLSSTHLYRKLKAITNKSTSDIIKNYRMQKAAQMIKNNEGNISEIMYSVGFSSLSSFSKSFKSKFGVAPSDYR